MDMLKFELGRRYERLLFFSGVLSLAAIFVLFVAVASGLQVEQLHARCFDDFAQVAESRSQVLRAQFEKEDGNLTDKYWGIRYRSLLSQEYIGRWADYECYATVDGWLDSSFRAAPDQLILQARNEAARLRSGPLRFQGVELPVDAEFGVLGTAAKFKLFTLAGALQIVLGPVLLLWLCNLYNTRYRESHLIADAAFITDAFPHAINIYPVVTWVTPKKRSRVSAALPSVLLTLYWLVRTCLVGVQVLPPVGFYVASLYFLPIPGPTWISVALGFTVGTFTLSTLIVEAMPWHAKKFFAVDRDTFRQVG